MWIDSEQEATVRITAVRFIEADGLEIVGAFIGPEPGEPPSDFPVLSERDFPPDWPEGEPLEGAEITGVREDEFRVALGIRRLPGRERGEGRGYEITYETHAGDGHTLRINDWSIAMRDLTLECRPPD